jgi:hypothetical protein
MGPTVWNYAHPRRPKWKSAKRGLLRDGLIIQVALAEGRDSPVIGEIVSLPEVRVGTFGESAFPEKDRIAGSGS